MGFAVSALKQNFFYSHAPFPTYKKSSAVDRNNITMWLYNTLNSDTESVQPLLRDKEWDGADGGIHVTVEPLGADLFEHSVLKMRLRELDRLKDY